jgi:hypothetical protein
MPLALSLVPLQIQSRAPKGRLGGLFVFSYNYFKGEQASERARAPRVCDANTAARFLIHYLQQPMLAASNYIE